MYDEMINAYNDEMAVRIKALRRYADKLNRSCLNIHLKPANGEWYRNRNEIKSASYMVDLLAQEAGKILDLCKREQLRLLAIEIEQNDIKLREREEFGND